MDRAWHYREAERLLSESRGDGDQPFFRRIAMAQAHATLASVPAEVEAEAMARDQRAADRAERAEWAATLTAEAAERARQEGQGS
jgi:hypothetical protein